MKEKLLSILSMFSAFFAAMCWTGGLLLAALGLGSVGTAFFANMTKYKPLFVLITGFLIYRSYSMMEKKGASKTSKTIFWISSIIAILIIYSPNILSLLGKL